MPLITIIRTQATLLFCGLLASCALHTRRPGPARAAPARPASDTPESPPRPARLATLASAAAGPASPATLEVHLHAAATRIIAAITGGRGAYERLRELCDGIGNRLSGSAGLEQAIRWALDAFRRDGQEAVRAEPVMVRRWVRGRESLEMVAPHRETLPVLGLGGSVGTGGPLEAEVVVVRDERELAALGPRARGRIVLFNNPMPPYDPARGTGYGRTVRFRVHGARMAAPLGAVAVLVRSVTARSLRTPHTGAMHYGDARRRIPAAAVTTEDADRIARLVAAGRPVRVRLRMEARDHGKVSSANVVAELRGRERPDEVVVIGAHLDSWDVGQGAHDDGAGVVMVMEALAQLRRLGLRPRRTIRAVLFTNEENGLAGGRAYAEAHRDALPLHVAAIEADTGGFRPVGFGVEVAGDARREAAVAALRGLVAPLARLGATTIKPGWSGADIRPMRDAGVPLLGLRVEMSRYFDYHHSPADTFDKVDPDELAQATAALAAMAYLLAERPGRLGSPPATGHGVAR